MSSQSSPQTHEPTMEEILASIRKIISEDQAEPAPAPVAAAKPVAVAAAAPLETADMDVMEDEPETEDLDDSDDDAEDTDILDLTVEVQEQAPLHVAEAAPAQELQAAPEAAEYASGSGGEADANAYDASAEAPEDKGESDMNAGLISDAARARMSKAFQPLDQGSAAPAMASTATMTSMDGSHLETIFSRAVHQAVTPAVQDWVARNSGNMVQQMKPIIREWMDENLPDLIEKAVKTEIAAAVRTLTQKR